MSEKKKVYKIKIPVYSSELIDAKRGLFQGHTYSDMMNYLDKNWIKYNERKPKLSRKKINKIREVEIQDIEKHEFNFGEIPSRLFKISAYNTNLVDGYVETKTKIKLSKNDKLGSDTHFMLLYPIILGLNSNEYQYQWKILLYEDPTKENKELVSICKIVLEKVFGIKVKNIKLDKVLEQLRNREILPELSLHFTSHTYDDNEVDSYLRNYIVKSSKTEIKKENFKNVPIDSIEETINDTSYEEHYQKRILKFFFGKKEVKLTNELDEAKDKIKSTVEEIFNSEVVITEEDVDKLFDLDFIIEKMTPVLQDYMSEIN